MMHSEHGDRGGALRIPPYGGKAKEIPGKAQEIPGPAREDVLEGLGLVIVVSVILGTLLFTGRARRDPLTDATTAEIADAPMALLGQGVSTAGLVSELLTEQALTLSSDGETVLVLVPPDAVIKGLAPVGLIGTAGQVMASGDAVDVTGTLWLFDRDSMADELGLVLHESLFAPWEGEPVVVADQIDAAGITTDAMEPTAPNTKEDGL